MSRELDIANQTLSKWVQKYKEDQTEPFVGSGNLRTEDKSVKALIRKVSTIVLKEGKAQKQEDLIRRLNSVLIGWTNYHKHVVASRTFSYVNNTLYLLLEQRARHRHPQKSKWWRLNKYWHSKNGKPWVFMTDKNYLVNLRTIDIRRHPKLQISRNPFIDEEYFIKRRIRLQTVVARNG